MRSVERNPSPSEKRMIDPNTISRSDFLDLLKASIERAGSQAKLATLMGVNVRSVERWLKGTGPSQPKMVAVFVNMSNLDWDSAMREIASVRDRSRTIQGE